MHLDKTTLQDLSFFNSEKPVFELIDRCTTQMGSDALRHRVQHPASGYEQLREQQQAVRFWMQHQDKWPQIISNGTLVMVQKFYESAEGVAGKSNSAALFFNAVAQKLFNRNNYSFIRFSVSHLIDFVKGMKELAALSDMNPPQAVAAELAAFAKSLDNPLIVTLAHTPNDAPHSLMMELSYRSRREIKHMVLQLMERYARLDAQKSMAVATLEHSWRLPELLPPEALVLQATQLYHPLLKKPVAYDIDFDREKNFLFLTGANMSGKSTLLRAVGLGALLAHIGMGVPAQAMRISFLHGIVTNMQVADNIFKGESYFFAEVQRMKLTAQKLNNNSYHLVLMDELFKGTNVHDAYECSRAVIEGLLQRKDNLMALSTHLNELADGLLARPEVWFRYCFTHIYEDGRYEFTYQLREGVSNDRIGYLVLKNEGVLELLQH
ncbi:MAG: DNA mismatch repair protein MutS [Edaphocola sp.]